MKYGAYLEEQMIPEWKDYYMSYKQLKKILSVLSQKYINKPPEEWDTGVSLSTPAPTNAAAMPEIDIEHGGDNESIASANSEEAHYTQNDFFRLLEADMDKVHVFTKEQVVHLRGALKSVDASLRSFDGTGEPPIGIKEQVDAIGDRFLKLEKYVNLNFTGFRKILKKHDKTLPNPCSAFYIGRLHQQGWVRGDYSDIIVNISSIYSQIRGDNHKAGGKGDGAQDFLRKTTKVMRGGGDNEI
jgi:SPX domain protein involved in polyphosphate accumulation